MNSKELKTYNLPTDRQTLYHLEVKPYLLLFTIMITGFVMMMLHTTIGLLLISISGYAIMFLPSRVLLEFTRTYLVMHNKASHTDCVMIYYEDIVSWQYICNYKYDTLIVELVDGTKESIECFNKKLIVRYMQQFAKDKQIITKKRKSL